MCITINIKKMENKPHCFAKMVWILDEPLGKEKNVCNRCESDIKDCLRRTRETAAEKKAPMDASWMI